MKKIVGLLFVFGVLSSCEEKKQDTYENTTSAVPQVEQPPVQNVETPSSPGETLVKGSDCLSCHAVDKKLIGPSYQDIAAKYANDPAMKKTLAERIIKGSQGIWGDVAMAPHPTLSQTDAEQMVDYILSTKK